MKSIELSFEETNSRVILGKDICSLGNIQSINVKKNPEGKIIEIGYTVPKDMEKVGEDLEKFCEKYGFKKEIVPIQETSFPYATKFSITITGDYTIYQKIE